MESCGILLCVKHSYAFTTTTTNANCKMITFIQRSTNLRQETGCNQQCHNDNREEGMKEGGRYQEGVSQPGFEPEMYDLLLCG